MEGGVRIQIQKVARVGDQKHGMHPPSFGGGGGVEVSKILESHCGVGGKIQKILFWWRGKEGCWSGLHLSYLNHSFKLSLNVKVCIRFITFLKISLCFLFVKCYVGWQVCALASHFHVFCFQLEGGVKSLRTRVFKNFRTGRVGGYQFGGRLFFLGGQYPITCHEKWEL